MADGRPAGITANRLLPIRENGQLETGAAPYPAFTGTPRAIGPDGALYFEGSARPEQRNPMLRSRGGQVTVVASAPAIPEVDGQAPPFGIWRNGGLLYASSLGWRPVPVNNRVSWSAAAPISEMPMAKPPPA
jgi:hypothetical protein